MKLYIFIISLLFAFTTCKSKSFNSNIHSTEKEKTSATKNLQTDSLPFLDTVIILDKINNSKVDNRNLTKEEAMTCLYKYFKNKGILPRADEIKHNKNKERLRVDYDTIYRIQTNNFSGAVISYWLGSTDLNGHCFQPQKSIIRNTINGYQLTDQDFVLTNFAIDSTVASNIYGYDYGCGGKGVLRHFKIALR